MNTTRFSILSRTESAASALAASLLSVVTVGVVLSAFGSVSPAPSADDVIVLDRVTISAPRTA